MSNTKKVTISLTPEQQETAIGYNPAKRLKFWANGFNITQTILTFDN